MGSADGRVRFFCELIDSAELALDIALYVSKQTVAVTPKQVRSFYFDELPKRERTEARHNWFIHTSTMVLDFDKTSGAPPCLKTYFQPHRHALGPTANISDMVCELGLPSTGTTVVKLREHVAAAIANARRQGPTSGLDVVASTCDAVRAVSATGGLRGGSCVPHCMLR